MYFDAAMTNKENQRRCGQRENWVNAILCHAVSSSPIIIALLKLCSHYLDGIRTVQSNLVHMHPLCRARQVLYYAF